MDAYMKLADDLFLELERGGQVYLGRVHMSRAAALLRLRIAPLVKALKASPEFCIDGRDEHSYCWACHARARMSGGAPAYAYRVNHKPDCQRQATLANWNKSSGLTSQETGLDCKR